ncbi:MAG: hypothetical protein GY928_10170 [Colwellia sp.]|nr:hypothetical protein [Colwellia sp.]
MIAYVSSAVLAMEGALGKQQLTAYILLEEESGNDIKVQINNVRKELQQHLASHMIPSSIIVAEYWPLTANGKIDKKALVELNPSIVQGERVAAVTETEKILTAIWSETLRLTVDEISVNDNFFELGGHSLLLVKLANEIQVKTGTTLSIKSLFDNSSIKALADFITNMEQESNQENSKIVELMSINNTLENLYCIPGAGALSLTFTHLAKAMKGSVNVYSFEHKGLMEGEEPYSSLDCMVEAFVEALLAKQAMGPYYIAGHSFGGIIANEMSIVLHNRGYKVNLITLDSYLLTSGLERVINESGQNCSEIEECKEGLNIELDERSRSVYKSHNDIARNFLVTRTLANKMLFLYASQSAILMGKSDQIKFIKELRKGEGETKIDQVSGDHYSILEAGNVNDVADKIKHFLF